MNSESNLVVDLSMSSDRITRATASGRLITHGKRYTYVYYECRCDPCKAAHAAYNREVRERRRAQLGLGEVQVQHGTASTYVNYNCRCPDCTSANSAALRFRRASKARSKMRPVGSSASAWE